MLSLEQVRALEARVEKAVAYIASLREENAVLKGRLAEEQAFIDEAAAELDAAESKAAAAEEKTAAAEAAAEAKKKELEDLLSELSARASAAEARAAELAARAEEYRRDQARIEEGIVHALEKLDAFEDLILGAGAAPAKPESSVDKGPPGFAGGTAEAAHPEPDRAPQEPSGESPDEAGSGSEDRSPTREATADNELDIF